MHPMKETQKNYGYSSIKNETSKYYDKQNHLRNLSYTNEKNMKMNSGIIKGHKKYSKSIATSIQPRNEPK